MAAAGYSSTPLPKKLGIVAGCRVALVAAPDGFEAVLGPLPDGVAVERDPAGGGDLALWFVRSARELAAGIDRQCQRLGRRGLWICWPKRTSGVAGDVSGSVVRDIALAHGLVDSKVCALDETWSGLRFTRRR